MDSISISLTPPVELLLRVGVAYNTHLLSQYLDWYNLVSKYPEVGRWNWIGLGFTERELLRVASNWMGILNWDSTLAPDKQNSYLAILRADEPLQTKTNTNSVKIK